MNDLIAEVSGDMPTDDMLVDGCDPDMCSGNQTLKRSSDCGQNYDKKRVRDDDNELCSQPVTYHINDSRLLSDEEEEPYREFTEEEQMIMHLSNSMINFSLDMMALDWDEYYDHRSNESPNKELSPPKQYKNEVEFPLKTGRVLHGYFLETLVATKKRTAVYLGYKSKKPDGQVVIKIGFENGFQNLVKEETIYNKLKTSQSVPKLLDYLWWKTYRKDFTSIRWGLIVLEKCGPNLVDVMKRSALAVFKSEDIAIKMIDAIESLHESGFIHSSLKPKHFLLRCDNTLDLKLISLSASKTYLQKSADGTDEHIADQRDTRLPKGDPYFHSIGYHNGFRRSRRDDMESLGYCFVYLAKGTLPWIDSSVTDLTSAKVIRKIAHKMQSTPICELCDGLSPALRQYFELISKHQFTDKPNYEELRNCFRLSPQ